MKDIFDIARTRGFIRDDAYLASIPGRKSKLLDFTIEAAFSVPMMPRGAAGGFGFMANTALSGGHFPCSDISCRIEHSDLLARFAALYSDHVVIRNPFVEYSPNTPIEILRQRLAGDLAVLQRLKPMLRAGLISYAMPVLPMCAECSQLFDAEQDKLHAAMEEASDRLLDRFMGRLTICRAKSGYVAVSGPEDFIVHGTQYFGTPAGSQFAGRLTAKRKEELVRSIIGPVLDDVYRHRITSRHTGFSYLTDRELDLTVIRSIGGPAIKPINRSLIDGLAHTIPIILQTPLSDILKLRAEEGESFAVYRHAVASVIREADLTTRGSIEDAFQSKILPELSKIDLAVRNVRKIASRGIRNDLTIGAAGVSIGLLVGSVQPALGAVLAALGGVSAVRSLAERAISAVSEPPLIRDNSFYFLWRLARQSKGSASIAVKA